MESDMYHEEAAETPGAGDNTLPDNQFSCRICLGEGGEPGNPLVCPCKCSGTMKYIHIKCLQKWLKSKLHPKQTAYSVSFLWKAFECELCKRAFPSKNKLF